MRVSSLAWFDVTKKSFLEQRPNKKVENLMIKSLGSNIWQGLRYCKSSSYFILWFPIENYN